MERKASKQTRIALIVLIVFLLASILSLSFAWFTDKKESTSNITFGNILLDVTGASAGENGKLKFNITRNEVTTTTNSKVMPGDIVNIDLTVGLKTNSQPAYYLLKLTDKTNKVFENSIYFSDGTVDSSNNLIVYQTDGTTSWEQNDATKTTTKMVGKITNSDKHNISIKAEISRDYEEENSKTEIICDIYAIQQANLTESEAKNYLLAGLNSNVPLEYTEVEYLESTGTQYIDTEVKPTNGMKLDLTMALTSTGGDQKFFGSYKNTQGTGYESQRGLCLGTLSGNWRVGSGTWQNNTVVATTNKTNLIAQGNTWTINGTTVTTSEIQTATNENSSFYIFAIRYNGTLNTYGKIKVYNLKFYQGNVLTANFVPCVRNSDNVAGLYETVSGKFHTNLGTGEFNTGDVVLPSDYTKKDYIQATGAQYIDTGYIANNNTKVDLEFETTNISKNQALFCSRQTIYLTNPTYTLFLLSGKLRLDIEKQQYATNIDIAQDTKYHVSVEKGIITVGSNTFNVNNQKEFSTGQSMLMFISNTGVSSGELTGLGNQGYMKMYSFKIYDNNKLVRDFVPCVRKSDGKAGMFDMVTKNFYVNSGTGADFITN